MLSVKHSVLDSQKEAAVLRPSKKALQFLGHHEPSLLCGTGLGGFLLIGPAAVNGLRLDQLF